MIVEANGFRFDALADGPEDGELVLLLHGYPQSAGEWAAQLPALAGAGFRAVAPDQRGYSPGARPADVADYHVDHLVDDALAIASALGAERFHLVGHDWGAIVSWHVAARAPERLRSLTIVSVPHPTPWAAALADPSTGQPEKSSYFDVLRAEGSEAMFLDDDAAGLRRALAHTDPTRHLQVLTDPGAMVAATNWYRAYDFHGASLPPTRVRTMFVWSDDDVAIARAGADATGDHVAAEYRYEVLEGVSHWIPEEVPSQFNRLLLEWLT